MDDILLEIYLNENNNIDKLRDGLDRANDKMYADPDMRDEWHKEKHMITGMFVGGIPGIIVGYGLGKFTSATKRAKQDQKKYAKKAFKYSEGDPITKSTVNKLLNACQNKKDIKKFEKWCDIVFKHFNVIYLDDQDKQDQADEFCKWLKKDIMHDKLIKKKNQIMEDEKQLKESFEFIPDYESMESDEFYECLMREYYIYCDKAVDVND